MGSFNPSKASICGILNFVGRGKCSKRGFRLLYYSVHGDWGLNFYRLLHVAELLLDILKLLLPRSFLLSPLMRGQLFTSIVPVKRSFVMTVSEGYVRIMSSGPAIFSSSVSVSRGAEVLLLLLWYGIATFMGLLFTLWSLHLSSEFCQLPQQALIDEIEGLHLVASNVESFGNVSQLPTVNIVLLVLCPRGVGVTPTHVSS